VNIFGGLPRFLFSVFIAFSPYFFYSAIADYLFICSADFGAWGVPNKQMYFCPFAAQNTMLAIFPALLRIFSPEHFFLCSGFRCLSANFSPIFCWRFLLKQFYLFSAQLLRSSGGSLMKIRICKFLFDVLTFSRKCCIIMT
jgi:hypothetical protein